MSEKAAVPPRAAGESPEEEAFLEQLDQFLVGAGKLSNRASKFGLTPGNIGAWALLRIARAQERQVQMLELLCRIHATATGVGGQSGPKIVVP